MRKRRKSNKLILFLLIFFTLYLMLRTSYIIIYDECTLSNFATLLLKRLWPLPFAFCFHPYSLLWLGIFVIALVRYEFYLRRPKAAEKWREIEHGSNEFQDADEKEDFIENCTDKLIDFTEEDILRVLNFIKGDTKC